MIDESIAGVVNIQFGIGSTPFIGSITIYLLVGTVAFHVVKANTPFLLSLANIDSLKIYYNNLKNVLVTPTSTILVIR